MELAALTIQTVFIGEGASTGKAGAARVALRVFALVGERRFEFVRLAGAPELEVYDFPKAWGGVARFCGYAPEATADKLSALAREAAARAEPFGDWHGRTIEVRP